MSQGCIISGRPQQHLSHGNSKPYTRHGCITCFWCGWPNHKTDNYYVSVKEAESYRAFLSIQTRDTSDDVWYLDMGVNQHMTPTFTNVKGIKQYSGINFVMVGNGLGFSILAIGTFQVPRTLLNIKNVLIVPTLKKRLLFVSQFTTNHNCYFVFYP